MRKKWVELHEEVVGVAARERVMLHRLLAQLWGMWK